MSGVDCDVPTQYGSLRLCYATNIATISPFVTMMPYLNPVTLSWTRRYMYSAILAAACLMVGACFPGFPWPHQSNAALEGSCV